MRSEPFVSHLAKPVGTGLNLGDEQRVKEERDREASDTVRAHQIHGGIRVSPTAHIQTAFQWLRRKWLQDEHREFLPTWPSAGLCETPDTPKRVRRHRAPRARL